MRRTILAVVLGWVSVALLVLGTDVALARVFPAEYIRGQMPPDKLAALSLMASAIWSGVGGWLCCFVSGSGTWRPAILLILLGTAIIGVSILLTWGRIQTWYQIGLLIVWPASVLAGAGIRRRQAG